MKIITTILSLVMSFLICGIVIGQDQSNPESMVPGDSLIDTLQSVKPDSSAPSERYIVYYFHSTRRCGTCKKLEEYSREAIEKGFEKELKNRTVEYIAINVDEKEYNHFVIEYQLFTKSVILSHVKDDKEIEWKNLDKIWDMVKDEKKYVEYVQAELKNFMGEK